MRKAADAFRSIGEVSQLVGVPPHVLRYWETQFAQLTPVKRADGRRYYRPEDLHLAAGICELLREEGMTTRGAARVIARDKGAEVRARGLARLPERFRGTADASVTDDTTPVAQSETEADETMARKQNAAGATRTAPARGGATPPPSATPEAAVAEPGQTADGSAAAQQAAPATGTMPDDQESAASRQADEHVPSSTPSAPHDVASDAGESADGAPEAAGASADFAAVTDAAAGDGEAASVAGPVAPVAAEPAPPSAPTDSPVIESVAAAVSPPQGAAGDVAPAPDHPAPVAGDLPLFPGLAPAAPPPGIWLPRLSAAADALREMPVPRRPTARMQHLRDRIAALIDADH